MQRVENDQIVKIIQDFPKEYAISSKFVNQLSENFGLDLKIDEVVLITMFLLEPDEKEESAHPVLLYIMHGNSTATSLKEVTDSLTHCHNAYAYDLALDSESSKALEEIKSLILSIDEGAGVIVIYDMGSIKTMLETIAEEIDVKIRYLNIPLTLIGIDMARRCSMENDIDYIYHIANLELQNLNHRDNKQTNVIVTLCHTGEGGAIQLKNYIDQYSKLGMKTVPLCISNRQELIKEVQALQKAYRIHAFVGTYDPKLLGVPFISITKVFEYSKDDLDKILLFEPIQKNTFNYDAVYAYLEEQFKYTSIPKLKAILPEIIDELSVIYIMDEDQRVGLFMHIACLIERLLEGNAVNKLSETERILDLFDEDYKVVGKAMKQIEKAFKVIIDDKEIATIIMMIKKI